MTSSVIGQCPVCGSKKHSTVFTVKGFPYFTAPVKKQDKTTILKKYGLKKLQGDLEPVICQACLHIYLRKHAPGKMISELYRDYYSYPSALEGSFFPERDEAFLKIFKDRISKALGKEQKSVLEIGCYDGYVLYHLKKMGFSVTGCDPSHGAQIGQKFGLNIKKRFFKADDFFKKGLKYEIVIFRHFLEHLPKPVGFLKTIKRILTPEGIVIFEVPNVEYCLKNGNTGIFSFQHLQYFSKKSVYKLAENADLHVQGCISTGQNLIVVCSKGGKKEKCADKHVLGLSRYFKSNFEKKKTALRKITERISGRNIILWGAGGYSANVLQMYGIPNNRIKCIVDSDKNKWDMEFLKHRAPITSSDILKHKHHDCLMVCSMYSKEILKMLKNLRYDKPIINLYPDIELLKN